MYFFQRIRIYECLQMLIPGVAGILAHQSLSFFARTEAIVYLCGYLFHLLFVYTFNDWCDYFKDKENPRKENLVSLEQRRYFLMLAVFFFAGSLLLFCFLNMKLFLFFLIMNILWGVYSLLKNRVFFFIDYGELLHFVSGALYFIMAIQLYQNEIAFLDVILSLYFGFIYLSGGILNELIDLEYDRAFGLKTFVIRVGVEKGLFWLICSYLLIIMVFNYYFANVFIGIITAIGFILYLRLFKRITRDQLNQSAFVRIRKMSRFYFGALTLFLMVML